ncbi:MAG: hypothetical protein KAV87_15680 [Desulfobacteraceae bacterium]|nr:hypothetical protein [Desulfobacteraceae bacterium]
MEKKKLIENLEDLATFLVLASAEANHEKPKDGGLYADFHKGEQKAYNAAYEKVDKILREAKK